jgi:hypothetical protein
MTACLLHWGNARAAFLQHQLTFQSHSTRPLTHAHPIPGSTPVFPFPAHGENATGRGGEKVSASLRRLVSLEAINTIFETLLLQHLPPLCSERVLETPTAGTEEGETQPSYHGL